MMLEDVVTIELPPGRGTMMGAQHARGLGGTAKTTCSTPRRTIKVFKPCECKQSMMKVMLIRVPPGSEHRLTGTSSMPAKVFFPVETSCLGHLNKPIYEYVLKSQLED